MRQCFALLLLGLAVGCAQPRQPTGGEPRQTQPLVVAVSPEPFSTVTELNRPVVIRFDERLSERLEGVRDLSDAVLVSPETGEVRARRGRRHVEVSVAGGWQPGLVYHVVVLPVLRDLFNNVRTESVELVFSTGAPIEETAVAGWVEDRITGRPAAGARVQVVHRDAGHVYAAVADTAGFFALRHVPAGPYDMTAWMDQDRDRVVDFHEPQDTASFSLMAQDTVLLELSLLPQDTTPARLARVSVIDSTKLELAFDDYFAPGPVDGRGMVYRAADSTFVMEGTLFHATALDSLRALDRAAEAALGDTAVADTVPPDTLPVGAPPATRRAQPTTADRQPTEAARRLPARELILHLARTLEADEAYYVVVEGVTNIQGVPGGGGMSGFRTPAPPPPTPEDPEDPEDPDAEAPIPPRPPDTAARRTGLPDR